MHFVSASALSALVITALGATAAPAAGSAHADVSNIVKRSLHRNLGRDLRSVRSLVPPTLGVSKRANNVQRRCRIRPPSSSSLFQDTPANTMPTLSTGILSGTSSRASSTASTSSTASPAATPETNTPVHDSPWHLTASHQGSSFFDNWSFWDLPDPTHGQVNYQNRENSWSQGLISINDKGNAIMRLDTTEVVDWNRNSVRIHDNNIFNMGTLLLMDAVHMPYDCATWPAFWSNGPNWPHGGEIDILEGVHDNNVNQATLHTSNGCFVGGNDFATGEVLHWDCGVEGGDNTGCGYADRNLQNSYGQGFNAIGGGVYAMQWTSDGISIWFHPRHSIPEDLARDSPHPERWGRPMAHWAAAACNPGQFFRDNFAIFDTTLCGDWAGNTWGSCAQSTGFSSCGEYVKNRGSAFNDVYWEVSYVKLFNN